MKRYFGCLMVFIIFFSFITGAAQEKQNCRFTSDANSVQVLAQNIDQEKKADQIHSINIAMASDNNYAYPMLVAAISALENKKSDTQINFYLMISGDFDNSVKEELLYLEKKYKGCKINIIDMGNKLKDLYTKSIKRITTASYYRILLPDLVPKLDKIVYLDVDALILKDLYDLFNVDVKNYYLAAIINNRNGLKWLNKFHNDPYKEKFGTNDPYFCAGTLVLNLKKMRQDKLVSKLVEVASKNNLLLHDMDALNWVCHGKITEIPRIYGSQVLNDKIVVLEFSGDKKPWKNRSNNFADLWWDYAKKSRCFEKIKQKFNYEDTSNKDQKSKNQKSKKDSNQTNKKEYNNAKAA